MTTTIDPRETKRLLEKFQPRTAPPPAALPVYAKAAAAPADSVPSMTLDNGAVIKWMLVTPALAVEWLRVNIGNRSRKVSARDAFTQDMLMGHWMETHQGLCFGDDGRLMDGQHRLESIAKSGASIRMLVAFNWPTTQKDKVTKTQEVIDGGTRRSIADALKMHHGFKNAAQLKMTAGVIAQLCLNRRAKVTVAQVLKILELYVDHINFAITHKSTTRVFANANIYGAVAFAHAARPAETEKFYSRFATGAGLDAGGPILQLRNFLLSEDARAMQSPAAAQKMRVAMAELVLYVIFLDAHKKLLPKLEFSTEGVEWFRGLQPERVDKVVQLFKLPERAPAVPPRQSAANSCQPAPRVPGPATMDVIIGKVEMLYGCAAVVMLGKGEDAAVRYPRAAAMALALHAGCSLAAVADKFKRDVPYVKDVVEAFRTKVLSNSAETQHTKKWDKFNKVAKAIGLPPINP